MGILVGNHHIILKIVQILHKLKIEDKIGIIKII